MSLADPPPPSANAFGHRVPSIEAILSQHREARWLVEAFHPMARALGVPRSDARNLWGQIWQHGRSSVAEVETNARSVLERAVGVERLAVAARRRAGIVARELSPFVAGLQIRDIGCGDGLVGRRLSDVATVTLCDVIDYRRPEARTDRVPFTLLRDARSVRSGATVDVSLLATVLHHADDPVGLLAAAKETTSRLILVIESVFGRGLRMIGRLPRFCRWGLERQLVHVVFYDWFHNRVLSRGVNLPYNYDTIEGWSRTFSRIGLNVLGVQQYGVDVASVPEYHVLFVLDRS